MSEKNTGGPAFPSQEINHKSGQWETVAGMSLRDYFSAHLQEETPENDWHEQIKVAILGRPCPCVKPDGALAVLEFEAEFRAKWRLIRADAMLAERARRAGVVSPESAALLAILAEVTPGPVPPSSADSYLPAHLIEQARAALEKAGAV